MKCTYCGGDVSSTEEKCSFCGKINKSAVEFQHMVDDMQKTNTKLKKNVLYKNRFDIINRILTRVMIGALVIMIASTVFIFIEFSLINNNFSRYFTPKDAEDTMKKYYEDGEFSRLYDYMQLYDLLGEEYTYSQIGITNTTYQNYCVYRNEIIESVVKGEQISETLIDLVIYYAMNVINPYSTMYPTISDENLTILMERRENAITFLRTYMKLTDEDIAPLLREEYDYISTMDLTAKVLERLDLGDEE